MGNFRKALFCISAWVLVATAVASSIDFASSLAKATGYYPSFLQSNTNEIEYTGGETALDISDFLQQDETTSKQDDLLSESIVSSPESSSQQSASSAISAATPAEAAGKIIKKTISASGSDGYAGVTFRNLTGQSLSPKEFVTASSKISLSGSGPQVLIVHTHATESYMTEDRDYYLKTDATRSTDNSKNMIAIGKIICQRLEAAGIKTAHITTQFDHPSYTGSYSRAATEIKQYLKKYPSIKVVLDVHRDSISEGVNKIKPVAKVNGKQAAQVMLVMGSQTGSVTGFSKWKQNLSLAAKFQKNLQADYPGIARSLMVASKKYNQQLTTGSMLIEVGTEANTFEEASYSAKLAGDALAKTLKNLGK